MNLEHLAHFKETSNFWKNLKEESHSAQLKERKGKERKEKRREEKKRKEEMK
jgi:hypothetical protein